MLKIDACVEDRRVHSQIWELQQDHNIDKILGMSFDHAGSLHVCACTTNKRHIELLYDGSEAVVRCTLPRTARRLHRMVPSPDGMSIALISMRGHIFVWDIAKQELSMKLECDSVETVVWSPDGRFLAGGSIDVTRVWRVDAQVTCTCICMYMNYVHVCLEDGNMYVCMYVGSCEFVCAMCDGACVCRPRAWLVSFVCLYLCIYK